MLLFNEVKKLKESAIPEVRQSIADKITQYFNDDIFSSEEMDIALEIIRLLTKDAAVSVRQTLSENLKDNDKIPHDVAFILANDCEEVALPMLEFCKVLTETDLLYIINNTKKIVKLKAIAKRDNVSEKISYELINKNYEEVILTLFTNKNAHINQEDITKTLKKYQGKGQLIQNLVDSDNLPVSIAENLLYVVSEDMKKQLSSKYNLSSRDAYGETKKAKEQLTINMTKPEYVKNSKNSIIEFLSSDNVKKISVMVDHLHQKKRLTQSIILRSLCEGNLYFFIIAMAKLTEVAVVDVYQTVFEKNVTKFEDLCVKAQVPAGATTAMLIIIDYIIEDKIYNKNNPDKDKKKFSQRLLEHIIEKEYDKNIPLMPYLMVLINKSKD